MRSLFETPPERPFCRFWSTFGVHLGTLGHHFFETFFDLENHSKKDMNMNPPASRPGPIICHPSPGPLPLFKKQWRRQRPARTQRVLSASRHLTFPCPGEGPFLRSSFETPPKHAFINFGLLLGSIWRPFGTTFSRLFSTSFSDPH